MIKRKIVRATVKFLDGWNNELHVAIESQVQTAYKGYFPHGHSDPESAQKQMTKMRDFYYQRMMNTGVLLIGLLSLVVALIALIVSFGALLSG